MTLPSSNFSHSEPAGVVTKSRAARWKLLGVWLGLGAIALPSFHVIGVLVFNVLGLAPGSRNWPLALVLFILLSISGLFNSLQTLKSVAPFHTLFRAISAASSGAILGLFVGAQLTGQETVGTAVGLAVGSGLLLGLSVWCGKSRFWFVRCFVGSAIALIGSLCMYAMTFVLSAWFWFAATTQHVWLAIVLGVATLLALWLVRRSLKTVRYYLYI